MLVNSDTAWVKTGRDNIDDTLGSFDSAQIIVLVGIYILNTLGRIVDSNNIGLYRNNGLISISNSNLPLISKILKKIKRAFRYMGVKIRICLK